MDDWDEWRKSGKFMLAAQLDNDDAISVRLYVCDCFYVYTCVLVSQKNDIYEIDT